MRVHILMNVKWVHILMILQKNIYFQSDSKVNTYLLNTAFKPKKSRSLSYIHIDEISYPFIPWYKTVFEFELLTRSFIKMTIQTNFAFLRHQARTNRCVNVLRLMELLIQLVIDTGMVMTLQSSIMVTLLQLYQLVSENSIIAWKLMILMLSMMNSNCKVPVQMEFVLPVYLSIETRYLWVKIIICKAFGWTAINHIVRMSTCPHLK